MSTIEDFKDLNKPKMSRRKAASKSSNDLSVACLDNTPLQANEISYAELRQNFQKLEAEINEIRIETNCRIEILAGFLFLGVLFYFLMDFAIRFIEI